jgi:hypothetical protein
MAPIDVLLNKLAQHSPLEFDDIKKIRHLPCSTQVLSPGQDFVRQGDLTQTQIGETLGMSLVSVNRNLQRLRKHAPADFKAGKLIVRDWEKLAAFGEFDAQYLHQKLRAKK